MEQVEEALCSSFARLDASLVDTDEMSGTCAVVALIERPRAGAKPHTIHIASLGDSRAILGREGGSPPIELSVAHKPGRQEERRRVEAAGGSVRNVPFVGGGAGGRETASAAIDRVCLPGRASGLAVSRAFGVAPYKLPFELVSSVPEALLTPTPTALYRTVDPNPNRTVPHC